jgi:hypothetical protein
MNVRLDDVDITSKDGKTYNLNQVCWIFIFRFI